MVETIDDRLLRQLTRSCARTYKSRLDSLESSIAGKSRNRGSQTHPGKIVVTYATDFAAVSTGMYQKLDTLKDLPLRNALALYVGARHTLHSIGGHRKIAIHPVHPEEMHGSLETTVDNALRSYHQDLRGSTRTLTIEQASWRFFAQYSNALCTYITDRNAETGSKLHARTVALELRGVEMLRSEQKAQLRQRQAAQPTQVHIPQDQRVRAEDIVGNTDAISTVKQQVWKLMGYKTKEGKNPYLQGRRRHNFAQALLLHGDTGSGKTLVTSYGVSLAMSVAEKYGIPLRVQEISGTSSYVDGGKERLVESFTEITQGKSAYVLLLDEIDGSFPKRGEGSNAHHQNQKTTELLKFLDGGGTYANRGNYLVLATCNDIRLLDRALINRRMKRIYCPGPQTAEEYGEVLKIHLDGIPFTPDIDWGEVGNEAKQAMLTAGQLAGVAGTLLEGTVDAEYHMNVIRAPTLQQAEALVRDGLSVVTNEKILEAIHYESTRDQGEAAAHDQFHGHLRQVK